MAIVSCITPKSSGRQIHLFFCWPCIQVYKTKQLYCILREYFVCIFFTDLIKMHRFPGTLQMLWKKLFHNKEGSSWSPFLQISRSWFGCCFRLSPHLWAFTSCVHSLLRLLCKSGRVLARCKAPLLKPSASTTDPEGDLPEGQQGRWLSSMERTFNLSPERVLWTRTKSSIHHDGWAVQQLLNALKMGHIAQIAQSENTLNKRLSSPSYRAALGNHNHFPNTSLDSFSACVWLDAFCPLPFLNLDPAAHFSYDH